MPPENCISLNIDYIENEPIDIDFENKYISLEYSTSQNRIYNNETNKPYAENQIYPICYIKNKPLKALVELTMPGLPADGTIDIIGESTSEDQYGNMTGKLSCINHTCKGMVESEGAIDKPDKILKKIRWKIRKKLITTTQQRIYTVIKKPIISLEQSPYPIAKVLELAISSIKLKMTDLYSNKNEDIIAAVVKSIHHNSWFEDKENMVFLKLGDYKKSLIYYTSPSNVSYIGPYIQSISLPHILKSLEDNDLIPSTDCKGFSILTKILANSLGANDIQILKVSFLESTSSSKGITFSNSYFKSIIPAGCPIGEEDIYEYEPEDLEFPYHQVAVCNNKVYDASWRSITDPNPTIIGIPINDFFSPNAPYFCHYPPNQILDYISQIYYDDKAGFDFKLDQSSEIKLIKGKTNYITVKGNYFKSSNSINEIKYEGVVLDKLINQQGMSTNNPGIPGHATCNLAFNHGITVNNINIIDNTTLELEIEVPNNIPENEYYLYIKRDNFCFYSEFYIDVKISENNNPKISHNPEESLNEVKIINTSEKIIIIKTSKETLTYSLYNLNGQKIIEGLIYQETEKEIDCKEIQSGIYALRYTQNGLSYFKKILLIN